MVIKLIEEKKKNKVASRDLVRQRLIKLQQKEAEEFKEHLDNLNDGVIAIILTVMVLEVPLPSQTGVSYRNFMGSIFIFLVSFFVVANFWYDLNRMLLVLTRVSKKMIINDFIFLAALSVIPMLTKWMMLQPSSLAVFDYGIAYFIANLMKLIISANAWEEFFNEVEGSPRMFSVRLGRRLLIVLIINAVLIFFSICNATVGLACLPIVNHLQLLLSREDSN